MTSEERIERLEHRVRELQTAVATVIKHLGIERGVEETERGGLDEIRLSGEAEAPTARLVELYAAPHL